MQDLDSAVGRLDNILMSVYIVVAILIMAVALVGLSQMCLRTKAHFDIGSTIGDSYHWCWNSDTRYAFCMFEALYIQ